MKTLRSFRDKRGKGIPGNSTISRKKNSDYSRKAVALAKWENKEEDSLTK